MVDGYENTSLLRTPEFGGTINRARPGAWGCLDGFGVRKMIGSDPVNISYHQLTCDWEMSRFIGGYWGVLRFDGLYTWHYSSWGTWKSNGLENQDPLKRPRFGVSPLFHKPTYKKCPIILNITFIILDIPLLYPHKFSLSSPLWFFPNTVFHYRIYRISYPMMYHDFPLGNIPFFWDAQYGDGRHALHGPEM